MKRGDIKGGRVTASKPIQNKTFKELGEEFLRNAEVRGLSEWTIKSYRYQIGYFLEFAGEELMCKNIGYEMIEEYIIHMKEQKGLSNPVTLNSYLRNINPIIKYGVKKRYILNQFLMPVIEGQETFKEIYTVEELNVLLDNPNKIDFITSRTHTVIWLLASTGIRARELRELRIKNVDIINRAITVNQTKNKRPRMLPISKSLYDVITNYMEERGGDVDDYLFPTTYNDIMAMTSRQDSIKKYCNERGVYKTSLHLFRHTFITNAVNQSVSPLILQRITGPTAIANSVTKVDHSLATNGTLMNLKFSQEAVAGTEGRDNLVSFIEEYIAKQAMHVQFNVMSAATMRAAQKKPEDYKDMLVRVAGYSAYFVELGKPLQKDLIQRTELHF